MTTLSSSATVCPYTIPVLVQHLQVLLFRSD